MAKVDDIERRLQNWARWKIGGASGGLGYASVDMAAEAGRDGYRESVVPTIDCEAEETDQAVMALPSELRATVEEVYLRNGTMARKARKLCCAESTIWARVDRAHRLIQASLVEILARRRALREHVQAVQQAARPSGGFTH